MWKMEFNPSPPPKFLVVPFVISAIALLQPLALAFLPCFYLPHHLPPHLSRKGKGNPLGRWFFFFLGALAGPGIFFIVRARGAL